MLLPTGKLIGTRQWFQILDPILLEIVLDALTGETADGIFRSIKRDPRFRSNGAQQVLAADEVLQRDGGGVRREADHATREAVFKGEISGGFVLGNHGLVRRGMDQPIRVRITGDRLSMGETDAGGS